MDFTANCKERKMIPLWSAIIGVKSQGLVKPQSSERERERWKMASINFPRGDLHAFIKHEEEIGRDVFLSLSLIIFTLMCKATFFFAPSSRLWLVSIGQYFEFSRQNLVWITFAKWDFFGYFSNSVFGKPWFCCCRLEERLGRARFSEENTNGQFCLCLA